MDVLINIDVDDLKKAERFYTQAFALKVGRRFGSEVIELLGYGSPIYLLKKAEGSTPFKGATQGRTFQRHWSPVHLDFIVDAIEKKIRQLEFTGRVIGPLLYCRHSMHRKLIFTFFSSLLFQAVAFAKTSEILVCQELFLSHPAMAQFQKNKERSRGLNAYENYLFETSGVADLDAVDGVRDELNAIIDSAQARFAQDSIISLFLALTLGRDVKLRWVDVGGGIGLAMRLLAQKYPTLYKQLDLHLVDLFDWENDPRGRDLVAGLASAYGPMIFLPNYRPELHVGSAEDLDLGFDADLVTSIESVQYVPDKLQMLAHWYNQLADGGRLVISTEHPWPAEIFWQDGESGVFSAFVKDLREAGIKVVLSKRYAEDSDNDANTVLIERLAGTRLELIPTLARIKIRESGYTEAFYSHSDKAVRVLRP